MSQRTPRLAQDVANEMANAATEEHLWDLVCKLVEREKIDLATNCASVQVLLVRPKNLEPHPPPPTLLYTYTHASRRYRRSHSCSSWDRSPLVSQSCRTTGVMY